MEDNPILRCTEISYPLYPVSSFVSHRQGCVISAQYGVKISSYDKGPKIFSCLPDIPMSPHFVKTPYMSRGISLLTLPDNMKGSLFLMYFDRQPPSLILISWLAPLRSIMYLEYFWALLLTLSSIARYLSLSVHLAATAFPQPFPAQSRPHDLDSLLLWIYSQHSAAFPRRSLLGLLAFWFRCLSLPALFLILSD